MTGRTGRGAWNPGPSCPTGYYSIKKTTVYDRVGAAAFYDKALDPLADHERAVNLGAAAFQRRMNALRVNLAPDKLVPAVTPNGVWGAPSSRLAAALQELFGVANPDGVVGPITSKAWFRPLIDAASTLHAIPWNLLPRVLVTESQLDWGAVGETTPDDKGGAQINLPSHPGVTLEQAFDPAFAFEFAAKLLRGGHDKYKALRPSFLKTEIEYWHCAVVSYNSPAAAKAWCETGELNAIGTRYLTKVLAVSW